MNPIAPAFWLLVLSLTLRACALMDDLPQHGGLYLRGAAVMAEFCACCLVWVAW